MAGTINTQKPHLTESELAVRRDELEREMKRELAPVEAKYWEGIREANRIWEEIQPAYQAMWAEKVVPHRNIINNIYRKYRRRMNKLTPVCTDNQES